MSAKTTVLTLKTMSAKTNLVDVIDYFVYRPNKKETQQNRHEVSIRSLPTNLTSRMRLATPAKPLPLTTPSMGVSTRWVSMPDRCVRMKGNSLETYSGRRLRHAGSHAWNDVVRFSASFAVLLWAAQSPQMYLQRRHGKIAPNVGHRIANLDYRSII